MAVINLIKVLDKNGQRMIIPANATNQFGARGFGTGRTANGQIIAAPIVPKITTNSASTITTTGATCGGNVISNGGTAITSMGVCWSTSPNPTVANSKTTQTGALGTFTSTISGLTPGTTYYVRAYVVNSSGTAYGNEVSFATTASVITTGLKLHFDTSNTSSYPGSGNTLTDISGNGNNGTLISGTSYNSTNGGTLVFDGIDDRVQTSFNPNFTDFTVCVWFKDNGSSSYGRLVDNNYINGFWIGKNSNTPNQWGSGIQESSFPFGIYLTLPDSQWHFLTSVRSGVTHTIYGDGITNKVSNTVSGTALNGNTISIGEWSGGATGQIFKGNIPQVLIYDRALTEAEIMQIFNATKAKYGY